MKRDHEAQWRKRDAEFVMTIATVPVSSARARQLGTAYVAVIFCLLGGERDLADSQPPMGSGPRR
jgi:hypothetical protein